MTKIGNRGVHIAGMMTIAVVLAGCTGNDDQAARMYVAPGKFAFYSCPQLAEQAQVATETEQRMQVLMERASHDSGGRLVSAMAYRPEYLAARGTMQEIRIVAAEKKCDLSRAPSPKPAERAYVPIPAIR